jgi:tetratricopeptide (TPR) repeat protein
MSFNKSKALESALKYLNQGKAAQAIAEYQQILRHDSKDQATLMTVGDLFARQGDMTQAIEYFERLAQVYLSDGFNSKAIAIYKKIAKLAPAELAPLERLADLYVQQGVLSEARPLFLQIAEAHLKANQSQRAVEILHRLLEIEPENPRVQMRLAELYNVMGQKKESAQTYLAYAEKVFARGEAEEALKLIERALSVDSGNPAALLLKGKFLVAANKNDQALAVLESHPEADAGGEVTSLIIDLDLKAGKAQEALDRARKQLARGPAHFAHLHNVVDALIEGREVGQVLPLLRELRDPMIEMGEQDKFLKSLSTATEHLADEIEPLDMLVDFCRHTSDSFRLPDALSKLSDAYASRGDYARAEELLQELIERNKDDERLVERLNQLRARSSGVVQPVVEASAPTSLAEMAVELAEETAPSPAEGAEEGLDEDTQRYISQALTDVDLFSSYGLTQKATHLLENVLQRAPRHTPTLERLLDLYLGAGNERHTAELAAQLEQIHRERNDTVNAERFAELRQRFQKVAGLKTEDLPQAPPAVPAVQPEPIMETPAEAAPVPAAPDVSAAPREQPPPPPAPSAPPEFQIPLAPPEVKPTPVEATTTPAPVETAAAPAEPQPVEAGEEVDLSDEWEAMSQEVIELVELPPEEPPPPPAPVPTTHEPAPAQAKPEPPQVEAVHVPEPEPAEAEEAAEEPAFEIVEEPAAETSTAPPVASGHEDFELELAPKKATAETKGGPSTTEDFISEVVAEIKEIGGPAAEPAAAAIPEEAGKPALEAGDTKTPAPAAAEAMASSAASPVPEPTTESLNQLADVFQEFRSELGELGEEDEDLETHYNLGIAYREMGLLDEAIGEFQKVAKAVQNGKPFPYAMNCSTLLALSFMDKGEPKIASLWYQRALDVPGLDQEAILALRYDLGVSQEMAGESDAALDSFRQVYAINIDYRDVADRIATLQKN